MSQTHTDHKSNQKNPNNPAFKDAKDHRSEQLNPNNQKFEQSRAPAQGK